MKFIFALFCLLLMAGCISKAKTPDKIILTSFYPIYIEALNVAADVPGVRVENLTRPTTGCLHDYQLTPEDLVKLETGSLFIINGLGMESFLDKIISQQPGLKIIHASEAIHFIDSNAHVWVSPKNAGQQVLNITKALAEWDPLHAALYEKNGAAYAARIDSLDRAMHQALLPFAGSRIITFHEAFAYFATEFNLSVATVIQREPGSEPSAADLAKTIDIIRTAGVKALFAEPQYSARSAAVLSDETGVPLFTLDPAVSGSPDKNSYISIMQQNLTTLQKALQ
jgi:zinc transport system substrate-binding protein